jgi:hypothetical protein
VLQEHGSNFGGKYLEINPQISKPEGKDGSELHVFSQ